MMDGMETTKKEPHRPTKAEIYNLVISRDKRTKSPVQIIINTPSDKQHWIKDLLNRREGMKKETEQPGAPDLKIGQG